MAVDMRRLSIKRQRFALLVTLLLSVPTYSAMAFSSSPSSVFVARLAMGGYYAEPEGDMGDANLGTHMVFGCRCQERLVQIPNFGTVTALQPAEEESPTRGNISDQCIYQLLNIDMTDMVVVELGASLLSLICARKGAAKVVAVDSDETSLRILEHNNLFMNDPVPCPIQPALWEFGTTMKLPTADLVIITRTELSHIKSTMMDPDAANSPIIAAICWERRRLVDYQSGALLSEL